MGKILHWKIKYNYVMRYRQGESPTKLSREIKPKENKTRCNGDGAPLKYKMQRLDECHFNF